VTTGATIVWFRQDLRLADNPALAAACARGGPVVPVYVWSPAEEGDWAPGAASRWWLRRSLSSLASDLEVRGSRLVVRAGPALPALRALVRETGASAIHWNRRYEPAAVGRDAAVETALGRDGIETRTSNAALLFEPGAVRTRGGAPFQVFTPFWNAYLARPEPDPPSPAPSRVDGPARWPESKTPAALHLDGIDEGEDAGTVSRWNALWRPGEGGAEVALGRFLDGVVSTYPERRDRPDLPGTSHLSPHLRHGEIGPRQIWHAVRDAAEKLARTPRTAMLRPDAARRARGRAPVAAFLRQLAWREFAIHLLHHFPHAVDRPLRPVFARFPWRRDRAALRRWQRGVTGYPIVDAGMRELLATGWMHNRVRMIAASFLVKDLLISWTEGAAWFWDRLVDADLANNTLGWQWVAGCGADGAPYFRVSNPVLQGMKFDPEGEYVRRWVPELARLPGEWVHRPWLAPEGVLGGAGVTPAVGLPTADGRPRDGARSSPCRGGANDIGADAAPETRERNQPSTGSNRATIAAAPRSPVTLRTVANMSGTTSSAIRMPIPSIGRPRAENSGASMMKPPRGTPGPIAERKIEAAATIRSPRAPIGTP
jgi:deoxyribodipyrimidine photo-lyase